MYTTIYERHLHAMASVFARVGSPCRSSDKRLDEKAEQEATGFLLDLVSVSGDNGLKLPRGMIISYGTSTIVTF